MILNELLGIDKAPGRNYYHSTGKAVGRPNEHKIRPRPKKNLWFTDDKLWTRDLDLHYNKNYRLKSVENEEDVVACDNEEQMAFGKWSKKDGRGITFKTPRPIHTVIHPKMTLKDYLAK